MTKRKLFFFDIDGTLLDHDKQLPAKTEAAVKQLIEKGHFVAIATGRAPFMFKELREKLGITTYLSFNGQYGVFEGEPIIKNPLDKEELARLTVEATKRDHPLVYMNERDMKANIPYHPQIETSIGTLQFEHPDYDPAFLEGRDIYQSLIFFSEEEDQFYIDKYDKFDFVRWHEYSSDVVPAGGSKAIGVETMMTKLGMTKEDVYVFGDGPNDIEMIKFSPNSVAMGNGVESVKEAASFVTKDVSDDGIAYALKHLGIL
ncbi:Cof-type HAD-IIB family hydrolase [Salipaludibacillus sp. LMS25]|jgi:Cof subfamily protein (haloacid dehalogenase superfamily)|uniref:Cof-type HAD-IIB family hydrolase n=1 Tax=Salipaludibacillus sp. LMS25 TaxID=2924031 RepID=UPI0020D10C63|nr:Cof-type HAD-IIB family hydrolase [Salipaludibacillus sp. LMS25]UTR16389.1 Cof-type HAD-IIB family hydrolase [Salipaludibacillus sp. LMS25]